MASRRRGVTVITGKDKCLNTPRLKKKYAYVHLFYNNVEVDYPAYLPQKMCKASKLIHAFIFNMAWTNTKPIKFPKCRDKGYKANQFKVSIKGVFVFWGKLNGGDSIRKWDEPTFNKRELNITRDQI